MNIRCCESEKLIFLHGEQGNDGMGSFRSTAYICAACGMITVYTNRNSMHEEVRFHLVDEEEIGAALRFVNELREGKPKIRLVNETLLNALQTFLSKFPPNWAKNGSHYIESTRVETKDIIELMRLSALTTQEGKG